MPKLIGGLSVVGTLRKLEAYNRDEQKRNGEQWVSTGNVIPMYAVKVLCDDPDNPEDVDVQEFQIEQRLVSGEMQVGQEVEVRGYVDQYEGRKARFVAERMRAIGPTPAGAGPRITANGKAEREKVSAGV